MSLVEVLKIIVLGIVEGFTEWLPISSTGHMILVDEIIRLNQPDAFKDGPSGLKLSLPVFRQPFWDFCWMTGWRPICLTPMWWQRP